MAKKRHRHSLDGFPFLVRPKPLPSPRRATTQANTPHSSNEQPAKQYAPPQPPSKKRRDRKTTSTKRWIKVTLFVAAGLSLGALSYEGGMGLLLVLLYSAGAIIFRVKSQTTLLLAFVAFLYVPFFLVATPGKQYAGNTSVYAFVLFAVGVCSIGIELRRDSKKRHKKGM